MQQRYAAVCQDLPAEMKAEGLPESVANIALEINPQMEVTSGEMKPLHKRWQSDDNESCCCNRIKPAKT